MADVRIRFQSDSQAAAREIERLRAEIIRLNSQFANTGRAASQAGGLVDQFGNPLRESASDAQRLTRAISVTNNELREIGATSLRSADALDRIGDEARQTTQQLARLNQSMAQSNRSTGVFTTGLGNLRGVLGGLGIAVVTHQLGQFSVNAVQAAGSLEQLTRATTQIEGSSEAAAERIDALIEVANLPGLQFEPLVRYSNRLRAAGLAGEDVDTILLSVGQTIVSLGGSAATAELAMEQLIQAFQYGQVDMRDFRTIIQQIPGFLEAMADVHDVEANMDGLREAFNRTGGSIRDLVIPTFDELSRRFEAPPADSYIVAMDTLENAFMLTQASIGGLFLPTIVEAAQGLSDFFEAVRAGVDDVTTLPEPIQEIIRGAQALWDALQNVAEGIGDMVSPPVRELVTELAGLIGSILELTGALYNGLAPVFQAVYTVIGTVVAAVAQLVEHITLLIDGLTTAVNWVSQFWNEEERAAVSTDKLSEATEQLAGAQEKLNASGDAQRAKLKQLQTELDETNARIQRYEERLNAASEAGISNRSTQQFERLLETARDKVTELEAEIERLKETYGGATAALGENATAAEQNEARLTDLQTQLGRVNTEIENYQDRLARAREEAVGETNPAIQHLERSLAGLESQALTLQTEIDTLMGTLAASSDDMDAASEAGENYSLALARLKANAEDTKKTLSDTIDVSQLGANYSAAIAASDAYYAAQIANAEAALAQEEENSEAYQKIETALFNLRREQVQARERLTQQAAAVGESESQRRIAGAEAENEALQKAGEETARALTASQKQQTEAAAAEQQRLTDAHETALREREAAQQASDARIIQNSQEQLEILQSAFQNVLPAGVDAAYSTIQQATIEHYGILKEQARARIADEEALNAELVTLDRQRNAELQDNHRSYLQRIASDAKDLLGERMEDFKEASDEILHDWERTVSEFERGLREADTEDAIREIEGEFTQAQQQMLDSLQSVLIELGFTAEQAAEIMTEVLRTAESESDSFADKVIAAFKRLGREAERETRQQNRQIERTYRELTRDIENILGSITDFFFDIANDGDIEQAFRDLGSRIGNAVLGEFEQAIAGKIAKSITGEVAGAGAGTSGGLAGLGSIASLFTNPATIAAAFLAFPAYGAYQHLTDDDIAPAGQGRGIAPVGGLPTEPFNRGQRYSGGTPTSTFGRGRGYLRESDDAIAEIETLVEEVTEQSVEAFGGFYGTILSQLQENLDQAAFNLDFAQQTGSGVNDAIQGMITANTEFYQHQIDEINRVRRETGELSFGNAEELAREVQGIINDARLALESTSNVVRFTPVTEQGRTPGTRFNATTGQFEQIPTAGSEAHAPVGSQDPTATPDAPEKVEVDVLASVLERINEDVQLINASILSLETQIDQVSEPEEIALLLDQLPALVREKYLRLREALQARFEEGDITEDVFNASISELASSESAELERQSDAALANVLLINSQAVDAISTQIAGLERAISQSNDPAEITSLLQQIATQIPEIYRLRREGLQQQYDAGEITLSALQTGIATLNIEESAALEQNADQQLANALRINQEAVDEISSNISALQNRIDQSNNLTEIQSLLQQIAVQIPEIYRLRREALQKQFDAGEITKQGLETGLATLNIEESATIEQNSDRQLANALVINQQAVESLNVEISALENAISQSNDPAEIQQLLQQIAVQIPEIYQLRRDALQKQFDAGEITKQHLETQLANLNIEESAALEQNSDQQLGNAIREINADIQINDNEINRLTYEIRNSEDADAIPTLLTDLREAIMEKYRLRREILQAQLDAEEITVREYQGQLGSLNLQETQALGSADTLAESEIEGLQPETTPETQRPDQQFAEALVNALQINRESVDALNASVSDLENQIAQSNDLTEIQSLLQQIGQQIPEIFRLRREALQTQFNYGEITKSALETGLVNLNIEESAALEQNSDTLLANALLINQQAVNAISTEISALENAISQSNSPQEISTLLSQIGGRIPETYRLRREALQSQYDAGEITLSALQTGIATLNIEESAALEQNADQQLANTLLINQQNVDALNTEIASLENTINQSNDPTEIANLLSQISEQIPEIYRLRRDGLEKQYAAGEITLSALQTGLAELNIEESAALEQNSDQRLANALSINQAAVASTNTEISALENTIAESNDPQEIVGYLQRIAQQIPEIYRLRRESLQSQFDAGEITKSTLESGIASLNIEESTALERNSDEQLANVLSINAENVNAINTKIAGLENAIAESGDPSEIANLLQEIAEQIPEIYRLRREALQQQFNASEITLQALQTGLLQLNIDESAAIERNSDQQLANALEIINTDAQLVNNQITTLSTQIENSDDPQEIADLAVDLRTAVAEKYSLQREILQKQLDAEEITINAFNAQLGALSIQETQELTSVGTLVGSNVDDIRQNQNALLQNIIDRAEFGLGQATSEADFETRRQHLITAVSNYYNAELARINGLTLSEQELQDLREDNALAREQAMYRIDNLENEFSQKRVRLEQEVAREQERITQDRIRQAERLHDIRTDFDRREAESSLGFQRSIEDLFREAGYSDQSFDVGRNLSRSLQTAIELQGTDDFTRNLESNISDLLSDSQLSLDTRGLETLEDIALGFTRQTEDTRIDEQIALQEATLDAERVLTTSMDANTLAIESLTTALVSETSPIPDVAIPSVTILPPAQTELLVPVSTPLQQGTSVEPIPVRVINEPSQQRSENSPLPVEIIADQTQGGTYILQLHLSDRVVQELTVRQEELRGQNRVI